MADLTTPPDKRSIYVRRRIALVAVPFLILAACYAIATIDIRAHDGQALRGVALGDIDVGGMTESELDVEFDRLQGVLDASPVTISESPEVGYFIESERLGLQIDRATTRRDVFAAGRTGATLARPFRWIGSVLSPRRVEATVRLDPRAAEAGLAAVSKQISVPPGDPTLAIANGRLVLEPGEPGKILDVERLVRDLGEQLPRQPGDSIDVQAFTVLESSINTENQAVIDRINGATTEPIEIVAIGSTARFQPSELRQWIKVDFAATPPRPYLDTELAFRAINERLGIARGQIDTRSLVVSGSLIRLPPDNATVCCQAEGADMLLGQILAGNRSIAVELMSDDVTPLTEIGIAELVGEFTTDHAPGQDRVVNIQRMAEIVKGAVISPGATFSLNQYVGERTEQNGFVAAGVIYDGVLTDDIGGGVSQFATTLFNAAFFAGMDIAEYQAHSIYFERYPYGREATVNWPNVDLKIVNPTEFPIMVWTETSATSVTVKLFGTAVVRGEQTGQTDEPLDQCTRVRTERTRTWADGRVDIDEVGAVYQPAEGVGCDGLPTLPIPECADDEALVDTGTDGFGDSCAPIDEVCSDGNDPVDEDGDGLIDFCASRECPAEATPTDSDGDGEIDVCVLPEPLPSEPEPEPDSEPEPAPTEGDS